MVYTLAELAARWGKAENDLLRMAGAGDFFLSVWHKGGRVFYNEEPKLVGSVERTGKRGDGLLTIISRGCFAALLTVGQEEPVTFPSLFYADRSPHGAKREPLPFAFISDTGGFCEQTLMRDALLVCDEEVARMDPLLTARKTTSESEDRKGPGFTESGLEPLNMSSPRDPQGVKGRVVVGWKDIAKYMECSESTAKRYAKGRQWLRYTTTGRPSADTADIDHFLTSGKKKKK